MTEPRTWQAGDRIAERDGDTWWLGTIVDIDRDLLAIRFDGGERAGFRLANSSRLVDPGDVPIDERHWLPAKTRDQLVRQEAAARLRLMSERLVGAGRLLDAAFVDGLIEDFDNPGAAAPLHLALAARALLNPAPQPAATQ